MSVHLVPYFNYLCWWFGFGFEFECSFSYFSDFVCSGFSTVSDFIFQLTFLPLQLDLHFLFLIYFFNCFPQLLADTPVFLLDNISLSICAFSLSLSLSLYVLSIYALFLSFSLHSLHLTLYFLLSLSFSLHPTLFLSLPTSLHLYLSSPLPKSLCLFLALSPPLSFPLSLSPLFLSLSFILSIFSFLFHYLTASLLGQMIFLSL